MQRFWFHELPTSTSGNYGDKSILQFGALMCCLTATMLLFPGGVLEPLRRLNPCAQQGFTRLGTWAILLMVIVGAACAVAAFGLWRCTRLGYRAAIAILSLNLIGDLANALILRHWSAVISLPTGGAMMWYLVRTDALSMASQFAFRSPDQGSMQRPRGLTVSKNGLPGGAHNRL
jgi:lysylphosphatidylglycerol synthetase-like protein (DUF2156 family)